MRVLRSDPILLPHRAAVARVPVVVEPLSDPSDSPAMAAVHHFLIIRETGRRSGGGFGKCRGIRRVIVVKEEVFVFVSKSL